MHTMHQSYQVHVKFLSYASTTILVRGRLISLKISKRQHKIGIAELILQDNITISDQHEQHPLENIYKIEKQSPV